MIIPDNVKVIAIIAGRGYGKTYRGAQIILDIIKKQKAKYIGFISHMLQDTPRIMIEGPSGILRFLDEENIKYKYHKSANKLICLGTTIFMIGFKDSNNLRGLEFDWVWVDEICKFKDINFFIKHLYLCLRRGESKLLITSTISKDPFFTTLKDNPNVYYISGISFENNYLSANFKTNVSSFAHEEFGQCELYNIPYSHGFWKEEDIKYEEIIGKVTRYRIGIDIAVGNGLTGMILCGLSDEKWYVLDDLSVYSENSWVNILVTLVHQYPDLEIIIEKNNGGNLIRYLLEEHKIFANIKYIYTTKSKKTRHQELYYLYKSMNIKLVKEMPGLVNEMLNGGSDRLDAMEFCLNKCNIITKEIVYDQFHEIEYMTES